MNPYETVSVFRVENEAGNGPFTSCDLEDALYNVLPMFSTTHPSIRTDIGIGMFSPKLVCGCESIESLRFWFREMVIPFLLERGFMLVEYQIQRRWIMKGISGKQLAFPKHASYRRASSPVSVIYQE